MTEHSVADDVGSILAAAMPESLEDLKAAAALFDARMLETLRGWLQSATPAERKWFAHVIATYGRERIRLGPPLPGAMATSPKVLWLHCRVLHESIPSFTAHPLGQRWHPRALTAFVYMIVDGIEVRLDDTEWGLDPDSEEVLRCARGYSLLLMAGRDRIENTDEAREWFIDHYEEALPLLPAILDDEFWTVYWLDSLVWQPPGSGAGDSAS